MKRDIQIRGFTLLEMLTALAIVAIMITLLIPAIHKIGETAHVVKQKAQFHAIGVGLESFRVDAGDYPPSEYTGDKETGYCGAQKLAEAMVGWDGFGYHPKSAWRSDGIADFNGDGIATEKIYDTVNGIENGTLQTAEENLKVRKGPYLELEKSNAVKLGSIYPDNPNSPLDIVAQQTYVLSDMFGTVYNKTTGKKSGMPILYYRADTSKALFKPTTLGTDHTNTSTDAIYNVNDNYPFFTYVAPTGDIHPFASDRELFYKRIANPNFTSPQRPYRAQSFILLSAGADGLYGSPDDVYNIDENEK
ncbi:MAG: prepilin-type N-terminal cleavage/methylation domain-containing protein [Sedimentisphaerales bacterium]|nr:prepilin-type N-terminal cleavage/methylation domain-containing protein [Sedimentisphaerales bacterium]